MGNPDLTPDRHPVSPQDRRGLVIFPATPARAQAMADWWLVVLALVLAAGMIAIAFAIR